ncbi:uncharacterized protein KY384_007609 [Bacidia gigantensis]|uniref:uncharacterized protein n=1 Tax=Bacidia gigantensis TaxID=2732470 RepID=UPI001D0449BB|nr:uncharacterized protein KY384_007609 [Bacidia gigantensis]KAG8527457.1 hypothetical protein KY384_007609 [Bacidia gigantensis]
MDINSFRQAARSYINSISLGQPLDDRRVLQLTYPGEIELPGLAKILALEQPPGNQQELLENVLILEDFIKYTIRPAGSDPVETSTEVIKYLVNNSLPRSGFLDPLPYSQDEELHLTEKDIAWFYVLSYRTFLCLKHFQPPSLDAEDNTLILRVGFLASYTDLNDPWTSAILHKKSTELLKDSFQFYTSKAWKNLLTGLLEVKVKPAFAVKNHPKITKSARKVIGMGETRATLAGEDIMIKPWKFDEVFVPTILRWVLLQLEQVDTTFIEAVWPLIVPPILTLIDDTSIKYKIAGCSDLAVLLQMRPFAMLNRTGLGEVFEDAVMPCLMYLPTLEKEVDSVALLKEAYPAIIRLGCERFPTTEHQDLRMRSLDRIMRYGILKGYAHAGEYARIAEVLITQVIELVKQMGIHVVRHAKSTLTFVWPRMAYYRVNVLESLVLCWLRVRGDEASFAHSKPIHNEIKATLSLVAALMPKDVDFFSEFRELVQSDPRLEELLIDDGWRDSW